MNTDTELLKDIFKGSLIYMIFDIIVLIFFMLGFRSSGSAIMAIGNLLLPCANIVINILHTSLHTDSRFELSRVDTYPLGGFLFLVLLAGLVSVSLSCAIMSGIMTYESMIGLLVYG